MGEPERLFAVIVSKFAGLSSYVSHALGTAPSEYPLDNNYNLSICRAGYCLYYRLLLDWDSIRLIPFLMQIRATQD